MSENANASWTTWLRVPVTNTFDFGVSSQFDCEGAIHAFEDYYQNSKSRLIKNRACLSEDIMMIIQKYNGHYAGHYWDERTHTDIFNFKLSNLDVNAAKEEIRQRMLYQGNWDQYSYARRQEEEKRKKRALRPLAQKPMTRKEMKRQRIKENSALVEEITQNEIEERYKENRKKADAVLKAIRSTRKALEDFNNSYHCSNF